MPDTLIGDFLLTLHDLDADLAAETDRNRRAMLMDTRRRIVAAIAELTRQPRPVDPPGCAWRRHNVAGGILPRSWGAKRR